MSTTATSSGLRRTARVMFTLIASVLVLAAGVGIYKYLTANPRTSVRKPPVRTARLVEIAPAERGDYPVALTVMGEAAPAREIELRPQVSGRVISIAAALVPGGRFNEYDTIVQIDPTDYELSMFERESEVRQAHSAVTSARSALTTAEKELAMERGNQAVAKREFELLGQDIPEDDRTLILRQPQLQAAEADVDSARAAVESAEAAVSAAESRHAQSRLNFERTTIPVPFNAVVMDKYVDIGDVVTAATVLASLIGTDEAWVELSVPTSEIRWIEFPRGDVPGSRVEIYNDSAWGVGVARIGRVIQLLPLLDPEGRMARVLVAIEDPLALKVKAPTGDRSDGAGSATQSAALLMGSYVRVRIIGPTMENVVRLPRAVVWEGDIVRVMNDADELELRRVTVLFREPEHVLISSGIEAGDRIVTTDLGTAVAGLPLRLDEVIEAVRSSEPAPGRNLP